MYTQEQLLRDIKALGVNENDLLTAHTSLKSVGEIDKGQNPSAAETLVLALKESVKKGLLLIPSHTATPSSNTPSR